MEEIANYLDPISKAIWFTPFLRVQILLQTQDLIPTFKNSSPLKGFLDTYRRILTTESRLHLWKGGLSYMVLSTGNLFFRFRFISEIKGVDDSQKEGLLGYLMVKPDPIKSAAIMAWSLLFHPFEVVRVRMSCHNFGVNNPGFESHSAVLKPLLQTQGVRALYRGYFPLTAYMIIQQDIFEFMDDPNTSAQRFVRNIMLYPLVVIGHRMMIDVPPQENRFRSAAEQCKDTFKKFGVRGFYKGFQLNFCIQLMSLVPMVVATSKEALDSYS